MEGPKTVAPARSHAHERRNRHCPLMHPELRRLAAGNVPFVDGEEATVVRPSTPATR